MNLDTSFADLHKMLPDSGIVLAAVSGGGDSMCMLSWLFALAKKRGFSLACAHFNHGLRGERAAADAAFVEDFCKTWGIPFYLGFGDTADYARENRQSIEEAARSLRYAFLFEMAEKIGAMRIATAHTQDDNGETVLANLIRGTGLSGLCGIPPTRGMLIRPLLQTSRKTVEAYLSQHGISYVEDETNKKTQFTRNKIRHLMVPLCKELNPRFSESIQNTVQLLRADHAYLEAQSLKFPRWESGGKIYTNAAALFSLPKPIGSRVIRQMLAAVTGQKDIGFCHISEILQLAGGKNPSAQTRLPGGIFVFREYETLVIQKGQAESLTFSPRVFSGEKVEILELGLRFCREIEENAKKICNSFNYFSFQSNSICGTITIRPRKEGDALALSHRRCTKSLKKLFIDAKIPKSQRNRIPIFADDAGPIAVYGFGIAKRCQPSPGDRILKIRTEPLSLTGDLRTLEEMGHDT